MKYSDIVDRPAYKAPDKCPICGDWPLNGYTPDIKTTEDGETVFVWRCRRCSYNYVVPGKKVSQKAEYIREKLGSWAREDALPQAFILLLLFGIVALLAILVYALYRALTL